MKNLLKITGIVLGCFFLCSCKKVTTQKSTIIKKDTTALIVDQNNANGVGNINNDSFDIKKIVNQFVYVSLNNKQQIVVYKVDAENNKLSLIERVDVNGNPGSIAYSRKKDFLYVALRSTHQVATFKIDQLTGKLKWIKNTSVVDNPVYIQPDKTNKFLLTAYWSGNKIAVYPIQGDSVVLEKPVQEIDPGENPHCIVNHPSNKYTYVAVMTSGTVNQFSFNEVAGNLKKLNPPYVDLGQEVGPRHIDFHPYKNWVYVINEINNSLGHYIVDTLSGQLILQDLVNTLPDDFTEFSKTADIHVTPNGKFVYISNRGYNSIAGFSIDSKNGSLKLIDQYATEANPREFEVGTNGKYLYSGGEDTGKMAVYGIQDNGALELIETYSIGESITWILAMEQKLQ